MLLMLIILTFAGFYYISKTSIFDQVHSRINKVNDLYRNEINLDAETYSGLLYFLVRDPDLINSWIQRDRRSLLDASGKIFRDLSENYKLTHLYFLDIDRVCFLRVHNPPAFGDKIERFTLLRSKATGELSYGLELGPYGTFTLRVIKPWIINNRLSGYIELGEEIHHITPRIKKLLNVDMVLLISKAYLNRGMWEEGNRLMAKPYTWDDLPDHVIIDSTYDKIPQSIISRHADFSLLHDGTRDRDQLRLEFSHDQKKYQGGTILLNDASGNTVGTLLIVTDITMVEKQLQGIGNGILIICIILCGLLILFFYYYLNKIEKIILYTQTELSLARKEEKLFKENKIESLGIFAGGLAHDFNNLLTSVIGNITLALGNIHKDHTIHDALKDAEKASLRAVNLTHQLLTFSKGGAPIKKVVSVEILLRESAELVLSGTDIGCSFSIAGNLYNVEVDEGQISQVFHNILLNSRQAMEKGGRIIISAKNHLHAQRHMADSKAGMYIRIQFEDNGIGISAKNLKNIFDPYYTTKSNGSGLGLSICYSIIKKHFGNIEVSSKLGEGTVFEVFLPATDRGAVSRIEERMPLKKISGGKVLIMDDDDLVLKVCSAMLKQIGFQTVTAVEGNEALELYKKASEFGEPFDLVILDITIHGGMGGKEAIMHLKSYDPHIRAVVSSGYSNDELMSEYKSYGFSGVIAKPYKFEELKKAIEKILF